MQKHHHVRVWIITLAAAIVVAAATPFTLTRAQAQDAFASQDCSRLLADLNQIKNLDSQAHQEWYNLSHLKPDAPEELRAEEQKAYERQMRTLERFKRAKQAYDDCVQKQQEARREKLMRQQDISSLIDVLAHTDNPEEELIRAYFATPTKEAVAPSGGGDALVSGDQKLTGEKVKKRETTGSGNVGDVRDGRKKVRSRVRVKDEGPKGEHDESASAIGAELLGAAIGIGIESLGHRGGGGDGHVRSHGSKGSFGSKSGSKGTCATGLCR